MRLKRLEIKNFLSWGNSPVVIDFETYEGKKLLISGDNKQGKSTILDAVCFALYGRTIRPINKGDYINYINKRNMVVTLDIETITNEHMTITREQKTPTQEITENYHIEGTDDPIEKLSSKSLTLNHIMSNFYGLTYEEFKNSVSLTMFNKNIMELEKKDKRKFFENMFNISEISDVKDVISNKYNMVKTNKNNLDTNLTSHIAVKQVIIENIERIKKLKNNMVDDSNKKIEIYKKENVKLEDDLIPLSVKYNKGKTEFTKMKDDAKKLNEQYSKLTYKISFLETRKTYLEDNKGSNCSQCGNEITYEHNKTMLDKINVNKTKLQTKVDKIDIDKCKNELNKKNNENKDIEKEINEINNKIITNKTLITNTENSIKKQLKELDIEAQENKLEEYNQLIEECETTVKELNTEITHYEIILNEVLHDEGLRHYILSHYIDYINTMLAENIGKLNLEFDLIMDNSLNIEIQKLGMDINYWGLSLGERSSLNIVLIFVIVKLRRLTNSNFINMLMIDEFLDSGLSTETIDLALDLIEEMFSDTSIVMISHKLTDKYDYFDNIFNINKVASFSQLSIIK